MECGRVAAFLLNDFRSDLSGSSARKRRCDHGHEEQESRGEGRAKSRVKVGKLQLSKETIKDLTPGKQKQVQGGKMVGVPGVQLSLPARAGLPAENQVKHPDHRKGFKHGNEEQ